MPVKIDSPLTVTVDGERVPKALLTAFSKDKKPFSYFSSGEKPDLSGRPSPSTIRKSNPLVNVPSVPRVLPIVSDRDLEFEERRHNVGTTSNHLPDQSKEKASDMATLMHAQYNTPMPLYSNDNVQDVARQTQDFLQNRPHSATSGHFNPAQSGAYQLLQESGHITPSHSARLDEQGDEYPRYRGFVDPRVQSPSFKRLQYVTGMDSGPEDEISQEIHAPVKSRTDDVHSRSGSRQPDEYKPQWTEDAQGPRVAQRDPMAEESDREQSHDPHLLAKIAEAERPKVPAPVVPNWTRKAEEKRQKWQQYGDRYTQRNYEYQPPRANWETDARKVKDKWSTVYGTGRPEVYENEPRAKSAEPYGRAVGREARREPERKEIMKPYIAPTISIEKFTPSAPTPKDEYGSTSSIDPAPLPYSSQSTLSSTHREYTHNPEQYPTVDSYQEYAGAPRKAVNVATLVSGEALRPGPPPPIVPPWSKHAEYKKTVWESKRRAVDPDYHPRTVAGEPPPPWARRAEQTHSLWQSEADAWRQRQQIGSDPSRRATSAGPEPGTGRGSGSRRYETTTTRSIAAPSPSWRQRPVRHEMTGYTPPAERPATQQWKSMSNPQQWNSTSTPQEWKSTSTPQEWKPTPPQQWQSSSSTRHWKSSEPSTRHWQSTATPTGPISQWHPTPGGETKSQSSGTYQDRDGSQVSFTKEVYTSSDPGKDYSVLTEEEKKILEEPVQPGLVSRHVTKKYYKKTTHTSSTTSSTSDAPPATTMVTRYEYNTPTPRSGTVERGVSEY